MWKLIAGIKRLIESKRMYFPKRFKKKKKGGGGGGREEGKKGGEIECDMTSLFVQRNIFAGQKIYHHNLSTIFGIVALLPQSSDS